MKYWEKAWSLISGCTPVSPACDNCWLAAMEYRFDKCPGLLQVNDGVRQPKFNGNIILREDRLDIPLKTKKPTIWAVWSDLFHEKVPAEFRYKSFKIMAQCPQHTFLVCTKRPERISSVLEGDFLPNVFIGTTVENQEMADWRIPELLKCSPFKLFLSIEPMLEKIHLPYWHKAHISYVIAGCESGPHARPTELNWIEDLKHQCIAAGVPMWVKQIKINGKMVYDYQPLSTIKKEDLWK